MGTWQDNAKYADEFKKATTFTRSIDRRIWELRWSLAFGRITFLEFEKKMKILKKKIKDDN